MYTNSLTFLLSSINSINCEGREDRTPLFSFNFDSYVTRRCPRRTLCTQPRCKNCAQLVHPRGDSNVFEDRYRMCNMPNGNTSSIKCTIMMGRELPIVMGRDTSSCFFFVGGRGMAGVPSPWRPRGSSTNHPSLSFVLLPHDPPCTAGSLDVGLH